MDPVDEDDCPWSEIKFPSGSAVRMKQASAISGDDDLSRAVGGVQTQGEGVDNRVPHPSHQAEQQAGTHDSTAAAAADVEMHREQQNPHREEEENRAKARVIVVAHFLPYSLKRHDYRRNSGQYGAGSGSGHRGSHDSRSHQQQQQQQQQQHERPDAYPHLQQEQDTHDTSTNQRDILSKERCSSEPAAESRMVAAEGGLCTSDTVASSSSSSSSSSSFVRSRHSRTRTESAHAAAAAAVAAEKAGDFHPLHVHDHSIPSSPEKSIAGYPDAIFSTGDAEDDAATACRRDSHSSQQHQDYARFQQHHHHLHQHHHDQQRQHHDQTAEATKGESTSSFDADNCANVHHSQGSHSKSGGTGNQAFWSFQARRGHTALYAGTSSLRDQYDIIHVGWDEACIAEQFNSSERDLIRSHFWSSCSQCVPVFLKESEALNHYDGYCKKILWPILHYILWDPVTDGHAEKEYWQDYVRVNEAFADAIVSVYRPVWAHDYHLLVLPSILRRKLPQATIGLFLHTPFPSSEIFRSVPKRSEILEGTLGANMIGFQTYAYARHFISACTRVLGVESTPSGVEYQGNTVSVGTFPVGVDVPTAERFRDMPAVAAKVVALRETFAGKKIIVGRDRLDQIKGVKHKLHAFEKFLQMYPEWREKVVLIQVTSPQRTPNKLESKISELAARINGEYGSLEFVPLIMQNQKIDRDEYYALLSIADCALVTPVRDGYNLTSHEYIVCQKNNCGPLILSEFTGTSGSLSAAIHVNPWDYVGVANAIHEALTMHKEERFSKQKQLYQYVTTHSAQFWAKTFVKELHRVVVNEKLTYNTPLLDVEKLMAIYRSSSCRLLLFDYDGTLTRIQKTPDAAKPTPDMLKAMHILASDPKNHIFVISGRDQATLDEWLGIPGVGLSAEHGCYIKYANGSWINLADELDLSWKTDVLPIFEYYTERTPGSFIEQKKSSLTWHYRLADPVYGSWQSKECHNHLENAILSKLPVDILVGKKNLEVRPISINKGEIVKRLLTRFGSNVDFIFCAGDDKTDEQMWGAMMRRVPPIPDSISFSCSIGPPEKHTQASYRLSSPDDLIKILQDLAEVTKNS